MGKIFYLMGKSSSGKDTIYKKLIEDETLSLKPVVLYTTRPIRAGETEGVEYHFTDVHTLDALRQSGKLVEERAYQTCLGVWHYFTVDDGQIDLENHNYLMIGTLQSYEGCRNYFGRDKVVPLMIALEDGERLERALNREKQQKQPRYDELCRRFLADQEDFAEEKLQQAGIEKYFFNHTLSECLAEMKAYILAVK